jgi:tetratricopeptide (TPR) repeat protein
MRLTGEAHSARGEHQAALAQLEQALEIDHGVGIPARIYMDLMALGQVQLQLGDRVKARSYFMRARSVGLATADEAGRLAAERALAGLEATMPIGPQ